LKILVGGSTYIDITYTDGAAHIVNNNALMTALNTHGAIAIADAVKSKYRNIYGKDLDIWHKSMAIEIIGHIVPDRVCQLILDSPFIPKGLKDKTKSIIAHTSIIDSGELSVDSNRFFWNCIVMSGLANIIIDI